jgi:hypothetical protein
MVLSLGMGLVFVPISATALFGVGNHDAGVASAVLNTAQQIGGALGTAFLNTIAVTATANYFVDNMIDPANPANGGAVAVGLTEGFTTAFTWSAGLMILGAVIWVFMINANIKADMPIAEAVFKILWEKQNPADAFKLVEEHLI